MREIKVMKLALVLVKKYLLAINKGKFTIIPFFIRRQMQEE
jgi:hypothetical protein